MIAITYMQDFLQSKNKTYIKYEDYVDYIENKSKTSIKNKGYIDYIENNEKISFNAFNYNELNEEKVKDIKNLFKVNRENGNNLYRGVFSFDNKFLRDNNLIDENNDVIDRSKLMEAIQNGVKELQRNSRISIDDFEWIANFHFNTDNIHCHIAYIDKSESRLTDKQKEKMCVNINGFEKAKSKVINTIVNNKELQDEITNLRNKLRNSIKLSRSKTINNNEIVDLYKKYGRRLLYLNTKKSVFTKEEITDIKNYLDSMLKKDTEYLKLFKEYKSKLEEYNDLNNSYYGTNNNEYVINKLDELSNSSLTALKIIFRELDNNGTLKVLRNTPLKCKRVKYNNYVKIVDNINFQIKKMAIEKINIQSNENMKVYYKSNLKKDRTL